MARPCPTLLHGAVTEIRDEIVAHEYDVITLDTSEAALETD
jgi:hypothetical protein